MESEQPSTDHEGERNQSEISRTLNCKIRDYRTTDKDILTQTAAQIHLDEKTEEQSNQETDEWLRGIKERLR